jgi:protein ImuB
MPRLYASIISPNTAENKAVLRDIARGFSHSIEELSDGILFDVSGLERLIGKPDRIAKKILAEMRSAGVNGSVAVAETVHTALLLGRQKKDSDQAIVSTDEFRKLPLESLELENDAIGIFKDLGIRNIDDLRQIPVEDLINRYGHEFQKIIDVVEQKGIGQLVPNIKDDRVKWSFDLDFAVDDFEQLIFVINHGLDSLFADIRKRSLSAEHLDLGLKLADKTSRHYEIKTSFPTLDKTFWLKLVNLRVTLDPPQAAILSVSVTAHFTKPRPNQKGLYAVSKPEPESLLLTVNKLKKLVGESNVGVPVLLNQRLPEPFDLDADKLPKGIDKLESNEEKAVIAFTYFRPPLRAEVLVRDHRLVFVKTRHFSGHVKEYSGVWRTSSKWWEGGWRRLEWDIEIENEGVYRLAKGRDEWMIVGEYD